MPKRDSVDDTEVLEADVLSVARSSRLVPPAPEEQSYAAGRRLGGRYTLVRPLGSGGLGVVWEAKDEVNGADVAVKLLRRVSIDHAYRQRREVAALRLLGVPGVVKLLDDGVDDNCPYIVMERVEGAPFPGLGKGQRWADVRDAAISLLRTLERVHALGIVHRDIKPANVLVRDDGQCVLLDFGLAQGAQLGGPDTQEGMIVGTPDYIAPEQVMGGNIDGRTDLYAFGVMLFHCLSGRFPHSGADPHVRLQSRVQRPPTPLQDAASHVPVDVADWVDALLAFRPSSRPGSATELLARIRGIPEPERHAALPYLGDRRPIDVAVEALRAGQRVAVGGVQGDGRDRLVREVVLALRGFGIEVLEAVRAQRPLRSLLSLLSSVGAAEADGGDRRVEVRASILERLARGAVLVLPQLSALDHVSRGIVNALPRNSAILCIAEEGQTAQVRPAPISEEELRPIFVGTDRILHLREDAATELHRRTWGRPGAVVEELARWVAQGWARRSAEGYVVRRETLDRLAMDLEPGRPAVAFGGELPDDIELREMLAWVDLAGTEADLSALGAALGRQWWEIESALQELERLGLLRREGRRALAFRSGFALAEWSEDRRKQAHRQIAERLDAAPMLKLRHLLLGEAMADAARLSQGLCDRLVEEGRSGPALHVWLAGVLAARDAGAQVLREQLECGLEAALYCESLPWFDAVETELLRARAVLDVDDLELFAQRGRGAVGGADDPRVLVGERLPLIDLATRMKVARRGEPGVEDAVVEEAEARAAAGGSPKLVRASRRWLAHSLQRKGRYAEAAAVLEAAADLDRTPRGRSTAHLNAARLRMESGDDAELDDDLAAALDLARSFRMVDIEARCEALMRLVALRRTRGPVVTEDEALARILRELDLGIVLANLRLHEAAAWWRAGNRDECLWRAGEALAIFYAQGSTEGALLTRALMAAARGQDGVVDAPDLLGDCRRRTGADRTILIQCVALLTPLLGSEQKQGREHLRGLVASVATKDRRIAREVFSVDEALTHAGVG